MATWQFDLHYLPRTAVDARYAARPIAIPDEELGSAEWWSEVSVPAAVVESLSSMLPPAASRSQHVRKWGQEDGDRIDVIYDDGAVCSIFVRIDTREISFRFVDAVVGLAVRNDWLLRLQDKRIIDPYVSTLMSAIQRSDSFRFVLDPMKFIQELQKQRDADERGDSRARIVRLRGDE